MSARALPKPRPLGRGCIDFHYDDVADAEDAKKLVPDENLKFVMLEGTGGLVTAIFNAAADHFRVALRMLEARELTDECFKGAGRIGPDGPKYGSSSCIGTFNHDRPKETGEAQRLLDELRVKLIEIGVLEGAAK